MADKIVNKTAFAPLALLLIFFIFWMLNAINQVEAIGFKDLEVVYNQQPFVSFYLADTCTEEDETIVLQTYPGLGYRSPLNNSLIYNHEPMQMTKIEGKRFCGKRSQEKNFFSLNRADPGLKWCPKGQLACSFQTDHHYTICVEDYSSCPITDLRVVSFDDRR